MVKKSRKIICLSFSLLLVVLNVRVARAEAVPDILYGSSTVADCVMSYYAMSGSAVANTEWINTLYDSLGSNLGTMYDFAENGMLTINNDGTWQASTALTQAIENSSAYTSLGLDQVFNISAEEAAAGGGFAAASGASVLSGSLAGLGSTGVLPLLGGVTAAYWGGIALGTLIAHLTGLYGKGIANGCSIELNDWINEVPYNSNGFYKGYYNDGSVSGNGYSFSIGTPVCLVYPSTNGTYGGQLLFYYQTNSSVRGNYQRTNFRTGAITNGTVTFNSGDSQWFSVSFNNVPSLNFVASNLKYFSSSSDANTYLNGLKNGIYSIDDPNSPDLIGPNGNLNGEYDPDSGKYLVPDMLPQVDSGVQSGIPLTLSDWLNFANSVQNNNSTTNPLPDNSALFENLLSAIKKALPSVDPNPSPNPDPYTPPVVTPVPDPDYDPVPDNPDQPDYESEKQNQTENVPDSVPTGAPWTTPNLLDKFPFCIPKDMINVVKHFSSGARQAPYISWRFNPPNTPIDYTFNLDLSDFEEVATLLRALELAIFIVGLAFATRYIIGAS